MGNGSVNKQNLDIYSLNKYLLKKKTFSGKKKTPTPLYFKATMQRVHRLFKILTWKMSVYDQQMPTISALTISDRERHTFYSEEKSNLP